MLRDRSVFMLVILTLSATAMAGAGIDADKLRGHVEFLASDDLLGRDTGEPGIERAEEYVAKTFEAYGLAPLPGEDDYFVDFGLYRRGYRDDKTVV